MDAVAMLAIFGSGQEGSVWWTESWYDFVWAKSVMLDTMAEWSKALVLGTSLRAWVRIPLVSHFSLADLPAPHLSYRIVSPLLVRET